MPSKTPVINVSTKNSEAHDPSGWIISRELFCLRAVGIYYPANDGTNERQRKVQIVYSIILSSIHVINALRYFLAFEFPLLFSGTLLIKVSCLIFFLTTSFAVAISTYKLPPRIEKFLNKWKKTHQRFVDEETSQQNVKLAVGLLSIAFAVWLTYSINLINSNETSDSLDLSAPISPESSWFIPICFFIYIDYIILVFGYAFLQQFYIFIIWCLFKEFTCCRQKFRDAFTAKGPDGLTEKDIEGIRSYHQQTCELLSDANEFISFYLLGSYFLTVPCLCVAVYGVLAEGVSTFSRFRLLLNIIFLGLQLGANSIAGSAVHLQAHSLLDELLALDFTSATDKFVQLVTMFVTRLSGPPIGVSVWKLFVINTYTALTITGAILTYAVVVLQFQSGRAVCQYYINGTLPSV